MKKIAGMPAMIYENHRFQNYRITVTITNITAHIPFIANFIYDVKEEICLEHCDKEVKIDIARQIFLFENRGMKCNLVRGKNFTEKNNSVLIELISF